MKGVALVAGATGMTGSGIIDQLIADGDWTILALSRRANLASMPKEVKIIAGDIKSKSSLKEALKGQNITNVFYAALDAGSGALVVPGQVNLEMMQNLVEALLEDKHPLRHVLAVHGGKYYGHHLGPDGGWDKFKSVFVEDHPEARHPFPDDFYHLQEDYLIEKSRDNAFTWSSIRPTVVVGYAYSSRQVWLNFGSTVAVYAILLKELGLPLMFPGKEKSYNCLYTVVSNQVVGKNAVFTANNPNCASQGFNCANATFRWRNFLPRLAKYFDMDYRGPDADFDVEETLKDRHEIWANLVKKHNLTEPDLDRVFSIKDLQIQLSLSYDVTFSREKRARYGCLYEEDNLKTFSDVVERLQQEGILPIAGAGGRKSKL